MGGTLIVYTHLITTLKVLLCNGLVLSLVCGVEVWMTHLWLSCVIKNEVLCQTTGAIHLVQLDILISVGVYSLSLIRCNLVSLSSGVSTVSFSR